MKNLTLRIDEKTLAAARKAAALRGTTVAKLVRQFLIDYVAAGAADEDYARRELRRFAERSREAPAGGFAEDGVQALKPVTEEPSLEDMITDTGKPPEPGHDEWFRRQVQKALDDKKSGDARYESFDKVAAEFGFNAR